MIHEVFRIRYYELTPGGAIPLHTLCAYFQEAAGIDAQSLNVGNTYLAAEGLGWVMTRMQLAPLAPATVAGGSTLTVHSWHSSSERLISRREFYITNEKGETMLKGSTWWALIDIKTRRLARIPQALIAMNPPSPDYVLEEHNPRPHNLAGAQPVATLQVIARDEDIDSNAHVNNTHFTAWAVESTPRDIAASLALKELVITFKSECFPKDRLTVSVHAAAATGTARAGKSFWHIITRENDGKETARIHTHWE